MIKAYFNIFHRVFIDTSKSERLLVWKCIEEFRVNESVQFNFYNICLKNVLENPCKSNLFNEY